MYLLHQRKEKLVPAKDIIDVAEQQRLNGPAKQHP
jgi:hypothetical protein